MIHAAAENKYGFNMQVSARAIGATGRATPHPFQPPADLLYTRRIKTLGAGLAMTQGQKCREVQRSARQKPVLQHPVGRHRAGRSRRPDDEAICFFIRAGRRTAISYRRRLWPHIESVFVSSAFFSE
jgi:hypothetical protein